MHNKRLKSMLSYLAQTLLLAALYLGAARVGLAFAIYHENVTLVWPPTGIALAAILLLGYRAWPGLALGAFLATASTGAPVAFAVATAIGNPLAAVAGAYLLRRWARFHNALDRAPDVLGLVFIGAAAGTLISAILGATSLCLTGLVAWNAWGSAWGTWWLGDAMGVLVVAPPLLTWGTDPRVRARPGRIIEAACLMILVIAVNYGVYGGWLARWITYPLSYAVFPLAIWAALRFGPKGTATANLVTMGLAVWGTVRGFGPFAQISVQAGLAHLSFTAITGIAALLVAAVIAERDRAKEQIQKLARFPSENPNPVLRVARDGTVLYANDASLPLLDAWGCQVGQVAPHEWRAFTLEVVQSGAGQEREFQLGERILALAFAPAEGTDYANVYGLDITRRRQAELALAAYSDRLEEMVVERTRALHEAQEQLVRREKLALIGQLAGGVAHELRNPLGAIKNAAYLLQMILQEPTEQACELVAIVDQQVVACVRIIDGLLSFARTRDLVRQPLYLNDVIREMLARSSVPESIEIVMELDGTLPLIWADPHQLTLVLDNLVHNAIQAMPHGGRLVVRSKSESRDWVALSVTDTGTGISEEHLARVFEPLFTTKEQGIGLGLALVKILVEGHGGTIQVTSREGSGSTFLIRLPAGEEVA